MPAADYRFENAEARRLAGLGPVVTYEVWKKLGTDDGVATYEVVMDNLPDHQQASIVLGGYRHLERGKVNPLMFRIVKVTTEVIDE